MTLWGRILVNKIFISNAFLIQSRWRIFAYTYHRMISYIDSIERQFTCKCSLLSFVFHHHLEPQSTSMNRIPIFNRDLVIIFDILCIACMFTVGFAWPIDNVEDKGSKPQIEWQACFRLHIYFDSLELECNGSERTFIWAQMPNDVAIELIFT